MKRRGEEAIVFAMGDLKRDTIASLIWKLFERGGRAIVELVVQIVMARLLAPEQFGLLAVMLIFVNIGNVFVTSGLNTALIQAPTCDDDDCSTVFWMSFAVSTVLYVGFFAAAPLFSEYYGSPGLASPLRAICLILVINSFNAVQISIVSRSLKFRKIFHATIASVLVSGSIGIALAFAGTGLWALVGQQLSYQLANCIALAFQVRWRPRLVFRPKRAKKLFGFAWKLLLSGLLENGYSSLSDLIIGKQFSTLQLGLVSQGKKYPQAVGCMLDGAIQPVMMSAVARIQDDKDYVKRLVRRALKTSTFLIVPAMACFAMVAPALVPLLLGEQWVPAVPFLQMYCFIYALLPIHTTNLQALNGMGRSDLFLKLEVIKKGYGICIILFCAFVLQDVYLLVAGYIVSGVISTFVNSWPNKKLIGYSYGEQICDIAPAFLLAAAAAAIALPISLAGLPDPVTVLLQMLVMAAAYLLLAKIFRIEELGYLLRTVRGFLAGRGRA